MIQYTVMVRDFECGCRDEWIDLLGNLVASSEGSEWREAHANNTLDYMRGGTIFTTHEETRNITEGVK
jgi:hypothetical protein